MVKIGDTVIFHDGTRWRTGQVWSRAPYLREWWIVTRDQKAHGVSERNIRHAVPITGGEARIAA